VNGFRCAVSDRIQCGKHILFLKDRRGIKNGGCIMSFIGVTAISTTAAVQAQGFYLDAPGIHIGVGDRFYHRPYYNYYGGWRTWNGCAPGWTLQGGVCKPYRYGPWDYNLWYR
jgi:hypothetical protein